MQNIYSREFMSSSQVAAKLVFNIENCVDMSRVLHQRPTRPPDPQGREAFVYLMEGSTARSIKDLTIDDLSPWNSKKCKSSTRFSSVQFDSDRNSLIFNRYIISDTSTEYKPDCLFACYYCKHPIFDLVKKIFYACDGNRERCLPGTFVIFVYEFSKAERIYKTQRYQHQPTVPPNLTSALNSIGSTVKAGSSNSSLTSSIMAPSGQQQSSSNSSNPNNNFPPPTNSLPRHFLDSSTLPPLKFEDFSEWVDDQNNYELDGFFAVGGDQQQQMSTTTCLEDLLQTCAEVVQQQQHQFNTSDSNNSLPTAAHQMNISNPSVFHDEDGPPGTKRRKIVFRPVDQIDKTRNQQQPQLKQEFQESSDQSSPLSLALAGSPFPNFQRDDELVNGCVIRTLTNSSPSTKNIRHVFTSEALLENFRKNCLCNGKQLGEQLDEMDELFAKFSTQGQEECTESIRKMETHADLGGCLLVDSEFSLSTHLHASFLWFRNPNFLHRQSKQPVIHPVAALLYNDEQAESLKNGGQILLNEMKNRLGDELKPDSICRSIISLLHNKTTAIADLDNRWSLDSELCAFPCVRLVPPSQFRSWLRHKFNQLGGDEGGESEEFDRIESELLHSGSGVLESLTFEQFLRRQRAVEKGWPNAFRLWFREKSGWIFERCSLSARLKAGIQSQPEEQFELELTLESLRDEVRKGFANTYKEEIEEEGSLETAIEAMELICNEFLRKVLSALLDPSDETTMVPANYGFCIGREQWDRLSLGERRNLLTPLGLSSLLNISDSLDPAMFCGLNRAQKKELLSRTNSLIVLEAEGMAQNNGTTTDAHEEMTFAVLDTPKRVANYVQLRADEESLYCQCRGDKGGDSVTGPICEHILAVALKYAHFAKRISRLLNRKEDEGKDASVSGIHLEGMQSVEIICCSSSNGSS